MTAPKASFMTRLFGYFLPAKSEAEQEIERCNAQIAYWQELADDALAIADGLTLTVKGADGKDSPVTTADRHQAQLDYAEALEKVEIWKASLEEWSDVVERQTARERVVAADADHARQLRETRMRSAKWRLHMKHFGCWPDENDTPAETDVEFKIKKGW